MPREFLSVWQYVWPELFEPLGHCENVPDDLFMEMVQGLYRALKPQARARGFAEAVNDPGQAVRFLQALQAAHIRSESHFLQFLEGAHELFEDIERPELVPIFHHSITDFISRHNLRYRTTEPFQIAPTIEGVFASLIDELRIVAANDPSVMMRLLEFEQAIGDLRRPRNANKIKRCIHTGFNLMEAFGLAHPAISGRANTLGLICDELTCWPHERVRTSIKELYGFASDFEGLRHAGNYDNSTRDIELRDTVAMTIIVAGFLPYLTDQLDHEKIVGGI